MNVATRSHRERLKVDRLRTDRHDDQVSRLRPERIERRTEPSRGDVGRVKLRR